MSFDEKYNKIYSLVQDDIAKVRQKIISGINSEDEFGKYLNKFLNSHSKHIRPLVSFLYLKALDTNIDEKQILWQSVIELIHNGSLIHDDVIDCSDSRRGIKTFNASLGNHMAVILGDYILSFALKIIHKLDCPQLLDIVANTFELMCRGEITQYFSKYKIPTIEKYIEKTYNKTATLFETSLNGALIIANRTFDKKAIDFIQNFGIAFQLRDDIKNITNNNINDDIKNGIYTAPVIFSENPDNPYSGIEKAKSLLDNYLSKAREAVADLRDCEYKSAIIELVELLIYE